MSKQPTDVPDKETSDMAVCISLPFMSEHTIYTDLCALSEYVRVLTILRLFVIKLAQACRARPPRAVTQTPSLLTKKREKSLVLIISILWACLSAQNRHLSHPPTNRPQTSPRPYGKNFLVNTLTLDGNKPIQHCEELFSPRLQRQSDFILFIVGLSPPVP